MAHGSRTSVLVALCFGAAEAIPGIEGPYAPDRVIVGFKSGVATSQSAQAKAGIQHVRSLVASQGPQLFKITDGSSVEEKVAQLSQQPGIAYAEPDYIVSIARTPNDPDFSKQWFHTAINSPTAWDTVTNAKLAQVKVCHIDSGARADHPDLVGSILDGWNFVPVSNDLADYPVPRDSPEFKVIMDANGHGTLTAGIIAGTGNNGQGVAGVAWSANLLVCRFIWADGTGYVSDAASCLDLCREAGAFVSSNSWVAPELTQSMTEAILQASAANQLFVAASGNQGLNTDVTTMFPPSLFLNSGFDSSHVITVGSVDQANALSYFSNFGQQTVTLAAPGQNIVSTALTSSYGPADGTSMSCPQVVGVLALMKAYALGRSRDVSAVQLKALLLEGATAVPTLKFSLQSGKVLNSYGAVQALVRFLSSPAPPPPRPPPP
ncbi:subtilase, partial [Helicosporidium sp. ATCC 50920]